MNNVLYEKTSSLKNHSKRVRPIFIYLFIFVIIGFVIFSFTQISFKTNKMGFNIFTNNLTKLFSFQNQDTNFPTKTILDNSLNYLWKTIRITITGTVMGYFVALFTSIVSSSKIVNKYISFLFRIFVLFLRSFPALIFIYASQSGFEREFSAIMIIFWFSWIWSHKYLQEIADNADFNGYNDWKLKGWNKYYSFKKQVLNRSKNKYIMIFMYSLESNIRWTTMLATVGVIGIGFFIDQNIKNHFEYIGIPLGLLFLTIVSLEIFSVLLNKILLVKKSFDKEKVNYKKIINWVIFLIIALISIYQITIIEYKNISFTHFFNSFRNLKTINFELWTSSDKNVNSWYLILDLFYQVIASISIAVFIAIIFSILASEKNNKIYLWLPIKILLNFIKIIPVVVVFYLFNPMFLSPIGLGVIIISIHSSSILVMQLTSAINNIDLEIIKEYRKMGYSKFWVSRKIILKTIFKDLKYFSFIRAEVIFRNMIIFGSIGLSLIGAQISKFESRSMVENYASHLWAIAISIFVYNAIPIIFKFRKQLNKFIS